MGRTANQAPLRSLLDEDSVRTIVHTSAGDSITTYDGSAGWIAAPFRPVAVLALSNQDIDGLKLDVDLSFPANIRQALTKWRVGPPTMLDDREVHVVQGTTARGATATLYFDMESGLLVRRVRYTDPPVGRIPTQTDYSVSRRGRREIHQSGQRPTRAVARLGEVVEDCEAAHEPRCTHTGIGDAVVHAGLHGGRGRC